MHTISDVRTTTEVIERVVLTIGCFDGVHLGHQLILEAVCDEARRLDGTPCVMTLEPHPRQYFSPENAPNILTDNPLKYRLLEEMGIKVLYVLPFDQATACMPPSDFVDVVLVQRCRVASLVVGHDFAYGYRAQGDYEYLIRAASQFGFRIHQIPPLIIGGQRVSSTLIRERIIQGEVDGLTLFLGRRFNLMGRVKPGRGIGSVLGFPTANLDIGDCVVPAHGVYAAEAIVNGIVYHAAVNIGIAPTIRNDQPMVEAHLLDFEGAIAGETVELVFHKRLRPEKKFASRDDLIAAITADIQTIRRYFAKNEES